MKKNHVLLFAIIVISVSCNEGNANRNDINTKSDSETVASQKQNSTESKTSVCVNEVKDFLKWYKSNYSKISSLQNEIVAFSDSTNSQYRVNFKNAEKYFDALRSSGYFSDQFFQDKLKYFKEADKNLLNEKQNDGPPIGFEYDLILFTQEPDAVFNEMDSAKLQVILPDAVKLILSDHDLLFRVQVNNDKCVFNEIIFGRI